MEQKIVYIETYGCSANINNSEIMAGILTRNGFLITKNIELASIIIINTCVVKGKTESKIKRRIQDLKKDASGRGRLIIIAGCMPETDLKHLKKLNDKIIFLGTHHIKEISNIIRDFYEHQLDEKKQKEYISVKNEEKLNMPKIPENKLISICQISEGCLGNCSYCKTKLAKGKLFSYPQEEIIKNIENDLENGAKEIWITCQDCASYGLDRDKRELTELIKNILELKHNFKLRLGMCDPNNILPILNNLLEVYKNKKMYKFLHIPIQSASNNILENMNRKYKIEEADKIIKEFREKFGNCVIATDIIVGYPTETQEDHKKNIDFIRKYKPDVLNLSKFSSHKQTEAGKLKQISNNIIKKRTSELMSIHRETARENKEKYKGKKIKVFINKKIGERLHETRDENYNIILIKCEKEMLGKEAEVIIKEIGVHHMIGE